LKLDLNKNKNFILIINSCYYIIIRIKNCKCREREGRYVREGRDSETIIGNGMKG
jgi:hypothetical protein